MTKVLISDKLSDEAVKLFKKAGIKVDFKPDIDAAELAKIIHDYDGLAVRSATKVTKDIIAKASRLKVIGRAGIGVDNIDLDAATEKGIVVMNTPFGNSITTAEHTIAMLLSLARHIPMANASTKEGKWEKSKFMGKEVNGKTLGIIGCGNIGTIVASRAQGLGIKVIACDPYMSPERAYESTTLGIPCESLRSSVVRLVEPAQHLSFHAYVAADSPQEMAPDEATEHDDQRKGCQ